MPTPSTTCGSAGHFFLNAKITFMFSSSGDLRPTVTSVSPAFLQSEPGFEPNARPICEKFAHRQRKVRGSSEAIEVMTAVEFDRSPATSTCEESQHEE
jgi:hypothetical protein